jgi:hypothetical protein
VTDWSVTDEKTKKVTNHKGGEVAADFDFGGTDLAGLVDRFGETAVYKQALGALTVTAQSGLRSQFKQGKSPQEIQAWAKEWKPGERKAGKSPREKLMEQLAGMTPEERAALLKEVQNPTPKAPAAATGKPGKKAA